MRIRWTEPAARDLTRICDYIAGHDAPGAGRRVALTLHHGIACLTQFPRRGRTGRVRNTRELVFPGLPYMAIYRVSQDVIEISRILHGAQK